MTSRHLLTQNPLTLTRESEIHDACWDVKPRLPRPSSPPPAGCPWTCPRHLPYPSLSLNSLPGGPMPHSPHYTSAQRSLPSPSLVTHLKCTPISLPSSVFFFIVVIITSHIFFLFFLYNLHTEIHSSVHFLSLDKNIRSRNHHHYRDPEEHRNSSMTQSYSHSPHPLLSNHRSVVRPYWVAFSRTSGKGDRKSRWLAESAFSHSAGYTRVSVLMPGAAAHSSSVPHSPPPCV